MGDKYKDPRWQRARMETLRRLIAALADAGEAQHPLMAAAHEEHCRLFHELPEQAAPVGFSARRMEDARFVAAKLPDLLLAAAKAQLAYERQPEAAAIADGGALWMEVERIGRDVSDVKQSMYLAAAAAAVGEHGTLALQLSRIMP